jgi:hypothetical protein
MPEFQARAKLAGRKKTKAGESIVALRIIFTMDHKLV